MLQKQTIMKLVLTVTKMTIEQMLDNEAKSYNERIWKEKVNGYAKYPKCQFYTIPADGKIYSYDRFFVTYQIPEGIILFSDFGYSSSITNNNFCAVFIRENGLYFNIYTSEIIVNEKSGRIENSKEGRKFMAHQSKGFDTIWSNNI